MQLWAKILIGMGLGVIAGLILGENAIYLKPIGTVFLQLINMIIPLLILSSMAVGITNIHDPKRMSRVGLYTIALYVGTTIIAIVIGMSLTYLLSPGSGLHLKVNEVGALETPPTFGEILLSIVPSNPIESLATGNVLQIIFFALFLGVAVIAAGEKGRPMLRVLESLAEVMYSLTSIIVEFSPYGIFAIMAWVSGNFGFAALLPLVKFLAILYAGYLIQAAVSFTWLVRGIAKLNLRKFYKGMMDAILMSFSTSSSSATLPVTMSCVQENLGVSRSISGFMLPLGATVNMNGTALYQASAALFVAQAYGIELGISQIATVVLTATLSAIGTAGIPGSGFIMLAAVVSAAGLPIEGIAILAGIDRLREMGATVINVIGDGACAVVVAKREGELNYERFNSERNVI